MYDSDEDLWGERWWEQPANDSYQPAPERSPQDLADEIRNNYTPDTNPNQQRRPGYFDLEYWRDQGVGDGDIFDTTTGQLKPGWRRTGNGYERDDTSTTTNYGPPDTNTPSYWTGGTGSFTKSPLANIGPAPVYKSPGTVNHPAFVGPAPFKAPGMADVLKDPSYELRLKSGEDAIKRNAAARGNLRTGGIEKGLIDYNQTFASNEYGNVYQRAASEYDRLYNNLLGEYKLGYQQALDVNDQEFRNTSAEYAPRLTEWQVNAQAAQRAAELEYLREMDIWKTIYGAGDD